MNQQRYPLPPNSRRPLPPHASPHHPAVIAHCKREAQNLDDYRYDHPEPTIMDFVALIGLVIIVDIVVFAGMGWILEW